MNRLSGAPIAMHKKGLSTDALVLEVILRNPGLTIAEIAEELEWTNGKVDGSVNRLTTEGKASIKRYTKRGMIVKKVYPINYDKKSTRQIEILKEMVSLDGLDATGVCLCSIPIRHWSFIAISI